MGCTSQQRRQGPRHRGNSRGFPQHCCCGVQLIETLSLDRRRDDSSWTEPLIKGLAVQCIGKQQDQAAVETNRLRCLQDFGVEISSGGSIEDLLLEDETGLTFLWPCLPPEFAITVCPEIGGVLLTEAFNPQRRNLRLGFDMKALHHGQTLTDLYQGVINKNRVLELR